MKRLGAGGLTPLLVILGLFVMCVVAVVTRVMFG